MILKDFLIKVKSGRGDFYITSDDDDNYGADNLSEGKYFLINNFEINDADDLEVDIEELPTVFAKDWLYRPIIEIDGIADMENYRRYFEENGYRNADNPNINIVVPGRPQDAEIWQDEENLNKPVFSTGGYLGPYSDDWPYAFDKDIYEALNKIAYELLPNDAHFLDLCRIIFEVGFDEVLEMTDKDLKELEEEANGDRSKEQYAYIMSVAHQVAMTAKECYNLMCFIAIKPDIRSMLMSGKYR